MSPTDLRAFLEREILASAAAPSRDLGPTCRKPSGGRTTTREIGEQLFRSLLAGEVRSLYDISRGRLTPLTTEILDSTGLRVRLHLQPEDPEVLALCSLPWELLWNAGDQGFLSLNASRSIVRHLDLPQPCDPQAFSLPLRVLVVLARPATTVSLDADQERRRIVEAFQVRDKVHVTVLERATLSSLQAEISREQFHIVHFIGHGAPGGEGLLLETEHGGSRFVSGSQLAALLQGSSRPSLVFLNACETARIAEGPGPTSLALSLLQANIPAVLAMQFPISDSAAVLFGGTVFLALANGEGIDAAVSQGRLAIHLDNERSLEWATPVLFLRGTTSLLPSLTPIGPILVSPEGREPLPVPEEVPKKLHVFQRDLYQRLDDLRIVSIADYERLSEVERTMLSREILDRIIGLGTRAEDLLDLTLNNTQFPSKALLNQADILGSLDTLHRKSAIFSDHAMVCTPRITIPNDFDSFARQPVLPADMIALLLQHRDLIETGRMSVVPDMVQRRGESLRCYFDVKRLDAPTVDLNDPTLRTFFLQEGEFFRPAGTLIVQSSQGGALHLNDILEIEDHFQAEHKYFQEYLRKTLLAMNPEDETRALRLALQEVTVGLRDLDAKFESARQRRGSGAFQALASGALAVVVYAAGPEAASFLSAAFSGLSFGSEVSFLRDPRQIPDEVRHSPFFLPWLISRKSRYGSQL